MGQELKTPKGRVQYIQDKLYYHTYHVLRVIMDADRCWPLFVLSNLLGSKKILPARLKCERGPLSTSKMAVRQGWIAKCHMFQG